MKKKQPNTAYSVEAIQRLVADDITRPLKTMEDLEGFLAKWWCRHYNKPYKCAEIKEYTIEELMYEYFDIVFRTNPEALEKFLGEGDSETSEDEKWLEKMMGEGYVSKEEQEKQLSPIKKEIDSTIKGSKEEEISFKFDEFI